MVASDRPFRLVTIAAVVATLLAVRAAGTFAGPAPPGPDGPGSRLDEVKQRIAAIERDVERRTAQLLRVAARISAQEADYEGLVTSVTAERVRLSAAQQAYAEAKRQLDERVRAAYMGGTAGMVEALLGGASLGDLTLVLEAQDRQAKRDGRLAVRAGDLQQQTAASTSALSALLARQSNLLAGLDARRDELNERFEEEQGLLKELTVQRKELERLALAANFGSPGSTGMTIAFDQWAERFLPELAAPVCTNNVIAVVAWETAEYTAATWNPLATTYPMPGATNFNSAGVKNYASLGQGLRATVSTLLLGIRAHGYGDIIAGLAECAPPEVTAEAIRQSSWCHGCAGGHYVTSLVPSVEAYLDGYA